MSAHTPTPWIVRTQVRVGPYRGGHYLARNDTESATAWAKDEANAAFIVKAVNSHDALVTELKLIADWRKVSLAGEYEHSLRDVIRLMLDCADRALASIKEIA